MLQVPKSKIQRMRADMPQIKSHQFKDFAEKHKVVFSYAWKRPQDLRATQIDFDEDKIDEMVKRIKAKDPEFQGVINISMDGDVLDGHHRWIASLKAHEEVIKCRVIHLPVETALDIMLIGQT